jgi:PAS domain-containing protein
MSSTTAKPAQSSARGTRVLASHAALWRNPRPVLWIGAVFIAVIIALAAYDIVRSYQQAVANTKRELDTQARVIAEQTARSVQAADVTLRYVAEQWNRGTLPALSDADLTAYLREQAVGLVQIEGLLIARPDGTIRAASYGDPDRFAQVDLSRTPLFAALRNGRQLDPVLDQARRSAVDGRYMFPFARRLESSSGQFAGVLAARFRVEYFQDFYRDVQLGTGTTVSLVHRDGTLLARHPAADASLGEKFTRVVDLSKAKNQTLRAASPVDGVDRFAAVRVIPDYPLAIFVGRDASAALAPWRSQALGSVARTLALAALAATLLAILMRQFTRLNTALASLQASQDRFAVAVAGSDDGIWDWDFRSGEAFASGRAR